MSKKKSHHHKTGLVFEELEPRLLLSADPLAVAVDAGETSVHELVVDNNEDLPAIVQTQAEQTDVSVRNELVIIDSRAPNFQQLHNDVIKAQQQGRNVHVVILDAHRDGIEQINEALESFNKLDAVHIVSHGDDGQLQLGATQLNKTTLRDRASDISSWKEAFGDNGDLLIYGCSFAETADGRELVDVLGKLTATDVAASDDLTGNKILGGDWELEYEAGDIETTVAFSDDIQQNWQGTLEGAAPAAEAEQTTTEEQQQQDQQAQTELEAHQAALKEEERAAAKQEEGEADTAITQEQRQEIVIIDESVSDFQAFIDDLQANSDPSTTFEIVLLDNTSDGVERINEILSAYQDVDALHILSHSDDGAVKLGDTWLNADNLDQFSDSLSAWGNALDVNADLMIYGCNLAGSAQGEQFVAELAQITGADVAASDDNTGHALLNGDWELEYRHGDIETSVAVSEDLQASWSSVLVSFSVDTNVDTADANPGDGLALDGSGNTSLRAAIEEANALGGANTITLGAGNFDLSLGTIIISSNVTIVGAGPDLTVIDAQDLNRVFAITGGTVSISGVTLQNGNAGGGDGGGVHIANNAIVSMSDVLLTGNDGHFGGAIWNDGTLTLDRVTLDLNNGSYGGGLYNRGNAIVTDSTISNNTATNGGVGEGGGVWTSGAGNTLDLTNVTISGNSTDGEGGGLYNGKDATLTNVTITNNQAANGAGIHDVGNAATTTLTNTIVAGNGTPGQEDLSGNYTSGGNNLIGIDGPSTGLTDGVNGDQVGTAGSPIDPMLGALADNGGPTQTHELQTGSTAIDSGTNTGAPTTDQRGYIETDDTMDIGAYQYGAVAPDISIGLEAHLTFDAGQGAQDSSGNNLHGTLSGDATVDTASATNQIGDGKLTLDGATDYVNLNAHASSFAGLTEGTVSAWFKTSSSNQQMLFNLGDTAVSSFASLQLLSSGSIQWWVSEGGSTTVDVSTTATFNDGNWHHVAVTVSSSGTLLWVDGVELTGGAVTYLTGSSASTNFYSNLSGVARAEVGAYEFSGTMYDEFTGLIDDFRIYDRALTASDIGELQNPWIYGTPGDDVIAATAGNDQIDALGGNDTIDYSGAAGPVTVDLTATVAQNTGGSGIDTLLGFERVIGSSGNDTFQFGNPVDGATYHVDGNVGSNTIDLSGYASSAVSFGDGTMTIDMGGGQSFQIDYTGIESIAFSDITATVLNTNMTQAGFSGSGLWIDGAEAFKVDLTGGGTVDLAYAIGTDTLTVTGTTGTGGGTTLAIEDLNGQDLVIDEVTVDGDFASVTSDANIDAININGGDFTITTITIDGGNGTLGAFNNNNGKVVAPTTINASVTTVNLVNEIQSLMTVNGDIGSLNMPKIISGGTLYVTGAVGPVVMTSDLSGTMQIDGNLTSLTMNKMQPTGSLILGGDVGSIDTFDVSGPVHIAGNLDTWTLGKTDAAAPITIDGNVGSITSGDQLNADLTIGGDLDIFSVASVDAGVTITAQAVLGTLVFDVGGTDYGDTYVNPVVYVFDGATQTSSATLANDAPIFIDGAIGNWNFDEGSGDSVAEGAVGISTATLGSTAGADANDPTWTSGIFGQALHFDGVNDYVEIADAPGIDISGPEFSASLWVKPDRGPGTEDMFFMKGDRQGIGNVNYYLSWKDTGKMTWAFKSDGGFEYIDMDVTLPTVDQWNHIAVVFDRPTVSIYINGTEYTSSVGTGGTSMDKDLVANDEPLWIGAGRDGGSIVTPGNYSAPFSGAIDELALFDRALTDAEIEAIRTAAPPVVTASAFSIDENSTNDTLVGTVAANDPDVGDTLSYAITAGNTGGAFSIDASGQIKVANSAALDFETNPVFNLTIEATDDGSPNLSDSTSVTITLNNLSDAPTLVNNTGLTAAEGSTAVITNAQLGYTDGEQPAASIRYSVTASPANGQLELTTNPDVAITSFTQDDIDNSRVVYVHNGSETTADGFAFTVDDGQDNYASGPFIVGIGPLTNVTSGISNARAPDYSPDGSQVVFSRNNDIYVMNADGSNQTAIAPAPGGDFQAVWSPDGSRIAFTSNRDGNNEIYVIDADGSNETRITTTSNLVSDSAPAWSPDSSRIAFTSDRDGDKEIWVMDADGTNLVQLTSNTAIDGGASWSPDGSKIVFQSTRDGGDYEIYVMDADGSNQTRLTSEVGIDALGDWSPDGSKLLFYSERDGDNEIYVMDADGSNQVRLTNDAGDDIEAEWSPDGSSILFSSKRDGDYDIYSANVMYENTFAITVTPVNDAPLLDTAGDAVLSDIDEGDINNNGDLVSSIIASAAADPITDADSVSVEGIAVTGVDDSNGTWEYSTDGGSSWTAFGVVSDSAAVLLADGALDRIRFVPATNYNGTSSFTYRAWDQTDANLSGTTGVDVTGNGGISAYSTATETAAISVNPVQIVLYFSTFGDVTTGGTTGVDTWTSGDLIGFGDPGLSFEPGTTDGTLYTTLNLGSFATDGDASINAMHFVSRDITVGSANSIALQTGDLLLAVDFNETFTGSDLVSLDVGQRDLFVFRPDVAGNYSSGSFFLLLDTFASNSVSGISLVEQNTTVGDVTLTAGTFVFNAGNSRDILHFSADDVGVGTTTGTTSTLIAGADIGFDSNAVVIAGLDLIEADVTVSGATISAGNLLVTLDADDNDVGSNNAAFLASDIFRLDVSTTTMGITGTSVVNAYAFIEGADVNLETAAEEVSALSLDVKFGSSNTDPVIGLPGSDVTFTEGDAPLIIDAAATVSDADALNFYQGQLRVDFIAGGESNDRLAINNEGTGAGQVGVSGNSVSYGVVTIGTFTGGSNDSRPLVITFNSSASEQAVQAVMRNITYENVSNDPSIADRTVRFILSDGEGGTSNVETETIHVIGVNDAPTVSLTNLVNNLTEDTDTSSAIRIADIVITDDATGTNNLTLAGADAASFEIVGTELRLKAGTSLDFETKSSFDVTVQVDDAAIPGSPDDTALHTLNITDVNEAPTVSLTNLVNTLTEDTDTSSAIKIADIVITDDALGTNNLTLAGADAASFEIVGTELRLKAGTSLDFETKTSFDVTVQVDDAIIPGTPDDTALHTLNITDVNETPTVSLTNLVNTLAEDTDTSSAIKIADIVITDDALGTNNLTLAGADAASFEIVGTELRLKAGTSLDFETKTSFDVTVQVDDAAIPGSPDDTALHTLNITDVNEAPTVSLTNLVNVLTEDTDTSTAIKIADIVITDDALGTNNLTLAGADAASFEIVGTELRLKAGTSLDFETKASFDVTVQVDDATIPGTPDDTALHTLNITDVNEAPTVSLTNLVNVLTEDTDTSTAIKIADIVITDDALGTNNLTLAGADAASFEIVGTELRLKAGTSLDFETKTSFDVTVQVDDATIPGTPDDTALHTLNITDVNEAATVSLTNTVLSLAEDTDTSSAIKIADIVITDDALGTNNLTLAGADAASFEIVGTELRLKAGTSLDFETKTSFDVTLQVDDAAIPGTPDDTALHTLNITDVNEAATVSLTNTVPSLAEDTDTSSAIKIADIIITDDALGTNSLTLAGADAAAFEIVGTELRLKTGTSLDFETKASFDVTVQVDDAAIPGSPEDTALHTLSITDINEAPTVSLTNTVPSLAEDTDTTSAIKIADIVITDDALGTNNLTLAGADAASFEIVGTELRLKAGTSLDFETKASFDVTLQVDDAAIPGTPDDTALHTLNITDVNEAATVSLTNTVPSLAEDTDTSSAIKIADIVITDDALGTNNLTLAGADAASFEIVGTELRLKAGTSLDFETKASFDVTVQVDDAAIPGSPDDTALHTLNITDVNEAATVSLTNTVPSLAEDTDTSSAIKIADIVITDDALGTNNLTLAGADAAAFEIVGSELRLKVGTSLDFETKASFDVTVQVDDAAIPGSPDDTALHTLSITDVNEAATVSLSNTVPSLAEDTDTSSAIKIADIIITDDALGTNSLTLAGADAAAFEIVGTELRLKAGTSLDFETKASFNVTVQVDDAAIPGSPEDTALHTLSITDVNEAPTVSLTNSVPSLEEDTDTTSAIKIADIVISDDALGTNTLTLAGADAASFEIVGTELRLKAGTSLDFETKTSFDVTVQVDDATIPGTPDDTALHTLSITDINEAPTVSLTNLVNTLTEDTDTSTAIKIADIVITDDALGTNNLTLAGADAASFEIVGTELRLKAGTGLDFETKASFDVTVQVDDAAIPGSPDDTALHTLNITDVNEAPTISLTNTTTTFPENTDTSTRIKVADIVIADDALGTNTLSLSGADASLFEIDTGVLYLKAGTVLDFATNPSLDVTVAVDDAALPGSPEDTAALAVTITDVNDAPTVSLTNLVNNLTEDIDTSSAIRIADIVITDDATGTNDLTLAGADAASFEIVGTELRLKAGTSLDFETKTSFDVTVQVNDATIPGTPDDTALHTLNITDVNEAATVSLTNTVPSLTEDTDTSTAIKIADIVISDDALGTNTLTLAGADAASFEIVGTELRLKAGTSLDFETKTSFDVTVQVDDATIPGTPDDTALHTLNITDVNEAATVSLTNTVLSLAEDTDTSSAIKIADIVITDDALGTNNLTLAGADAASFEIVGTELRLKAGTSLDFETKTSFDVTLQVDDAAIPGTPDDTALHTLNITDVNEAATVSLTNTVPSLAEDTDTSSAIKIADIVISDDALGTNNLTLAGADATSFEIVGTELRLKAGTSLDFETKASFDVTVQVDDAAIPGSPDDTALHTLNITDVNETPTVSLTNLVNTLTEDTDTSTAIKIADIVITDDALGTNNLTLAGADAASFEIVGTELRLKAGTSLDFETKTSFDVTVQVDDATIPGTPDDTALHTLNITDVNEAPTVSLTNLVNTLTEDTDTSTAIKIADIVITDDALGTNNLTLAGADAASFEIVGTELRLKAGTGLDFETKASFDVTVQVDDAAIPGSPDDTALHTLNITDVNEAPTISLTNTTTTFPENTDTSTRIKVADIVIADDALGTNTLSLSGADASLFEIDTGVLYLKAGTVLDFATNPSLDVTVAVDDAALPGSPEDTAALAVTITDVNEAPTVSLTNLVNNLTEDTDTSSAIRIADIVITDDATGTNDLTLAGADAASFEIVGTELRLKAGTSLDFETKTSFDVTVQVDDATIPGTPDDTALHTLNITDVNEAATVSLTNTVPSLTEDTDTSTAIKIADIVISDDALGTNTLTLAGADAASFEIVGTELRLKAGTSLDFETKASFDVTVQVDDAAIPGSPDDTALHTLNITDVNEAATVSLTNTVPSLAEDTDTTSAIKIADIVITDDALGTNNLTLAGADAASFEIVGTELRLKAGTGLDFETKASFDVTVQVDDVAIPGSPDDTALHTLNITDVNEAPTVSLTNLVNTLTEDTDTSSAIKIADIVITDDALGTNNLTLTGADAASFEIVGTELRLKAGTSLDFETKTSFDVTVQVDDATIPGSPEDTALHTLSITDVNEAPTVSLTNSVPSLAEDTDTTSAIKIADIIISDDALGTNTLTLAGADAASFEIVGTELRLKAGTSLDFETKASFDVTVQVDDAAIPGSPDDTALHTLNITDVNETPTVSLTNLVNTLTEDTDTSTAIKIADIVITDDALGTNNLTLAGADAASFEIVGTELRLKAGTGLDFETKASFDVTVQVDDAAIPGSPEDTALHTLNITDVNEAATVSLTNTVPSLAEDTDTSSAIKIADIVITDDALGTNNLTLAGADAASFEIVGTELRLKTGTSLDFETKASFDVTVQVDDAAIPGSPDDTALHTLNITDVNETPTVSLTNLVNTLTEDTDTSTAIKIADIVITDDATGTNDLTLAGADAASFEIVGSELRLKAGTSLDFETKASFDVTVQVDDVAIPGSPEDTALHTLNITDVNEAPTISLTNTVLSLAEDTDTSSAIKIADIIITDDALGTNNLTLAGADAASFEIVGTELRLKAGTSLDFETKASFDVTVQVDDVAIPGSPDDTALHTLSITDINEAPTVSLTNTVLSLAEDTDTTSAIKIADIVITDDALGTNNLTLAGADAASFEIVGTELRLKAGTSLDFETKASFDVTVQVDDAAIPGSPEDTALHTLNITDVNEAPTVSLTNTVLSLAEDTDTSSAIKIADIIITDDALGTNSLTLAGADAAAFEIVGTELRLKAGTSLDFETKASFDVTVQVDDVAIPGSPDDTALHTLNITDINDAPVVNNDAFTVNEGSTTTLNLAANDTDADDGLDLTSIVITGAPSNGSIVVNADGTVDYTHDGSETLADSFTYTILDNSGAVSNTGTVSITVTPVNDVPVATANTVTTTEDNVYNFSAADFTFSDVEGDSLVSATITNLNLAGGTLTHSGGTTVNNGDTLTAAQLDTLLYTPATDSNGTPLATFDFTVNDTGLGVNVAQMSINVSAQPDPAIIGGVDTGAVTEDVDPDMNNLLEVSGSLTISDPDVGESSFNAGVLAGSYGNLTINAAGDWDYAADNTQAVIQNLANGATLTDTITVSSIDGTTHDVVITITGANDAAMIAGTDTGSVTEDVDPDVDNLLEVSGVLTISDTDTGEAAFSAGVYGGTYGVITLNAAGNWDYAANNTQAAIQNLANGATLTDTITVSSIDGTTHDVVITITGANDAAMIAGTDTGSVTEDVDPDADNLLEVSGALTIIDPDAGEAMFNGGVFGGAYGVITLNATGNWDYAANTTQAAIQNLAAGATLTDTFTVSSIDGTTHDIVITIMGTNDAPVAGNDVANVNEGGSVIIDVAATDSDVDNALDLNSIVITGLPVNGSVVANGDGTVTYSHNGSETLVDSFSYTISDISGAVSNTATVSLSINPVNDPPVAGDDAAIVAEGSSILIDLAANDIDVDNALDLNSINIIGAPVNGSLAVNGDGTVSYSHDGSNTTSDSFTYTIADISGAISNTATVNIAVTPVNDAPTTSGIASFSVNEDAATTGIDLNAAFADSDNLDSELSYSIVGNTNVGLLSAVGINNSTGQLTLDYGADMNGAAQISIRATDPGGLSVDTLFTVTVTPVNDAPVQRVNTGAQSATGSAATISATQLNASDIDNTRNEIIYTVTSLPTNGVLELNGTPMALNGTLTQDDIDNNRLVYQPSGSGAADQFGFTVADTAGASLGSNTFDIYVQLAQNDDGDGDIPPNDVDPEDETEEPPQTATDGTGLVEPREYGNGYVPFGNSSEPQAPPTKLSIDPAPEPQKRQRVEVEKKQEVVVEVEQPKVETFSAVQLESMDALWSAVNDMKQKIANSATQESGRVELKAAAVESSGVVLSAGVVAWLLRSGALLSSLMSSIPLWKGYDPLPVLAYKDDDDEKKDVEIDEDKIPTSLEELKKLRELQQKKTGGVDVDSMFGGPAIRE